MRELPRMDVASRWHFGTLLCAALVLGSCSLVFSEGEPGEASDAGGSLADAAALDAGSILDAGPVFDAAVPLSDESLLLRYYLDDDMPPILRDVGQSPADNLVMESIVVSGTSGRRGLRWETASAPGGACAVLLKHTLSELEAQDTFTFEFVVRVDGAGPTAAPSILFILANDAPGEGNTSLQVHSEEGNDYVVDFVFDGVVVQSWSDPELASRSVLHLVFASPESEGSKRVRLYSNGVELSSTSAANELAEFSVMKIDKASTFTLGNAPTQGTQSIAGKLGYFAVYHEPLTDTVISRNASILLKDDDTPE